ncbi:Tim21 protein [Saccharomycopsis crataegensis]|uniref:Mitochondrial import inner membrane translocase subunit Tim21 n=1 Tax=Saccharomycopsis crataegensis TaxID=43959 RepID=A0AAV5QG91_9ASCO|nr:Tim21 protein [Saccharomycopsis crataegensis]
MSVIARQGRILPLAYESATRTSILRHHYRNYATHKENPETDTKKKDTSTGPSFFTKLKSGSTFALSTLLVVGSLGLTGLGIYAIGAELFSSSGDTKLFNRSINLIQNNLHCQKLLQCAHGDETLSAHGEDYTLGNRNGWGNRNRQVNSTKTIEKNTGNEHYYMRYHVESSKKRGTVQMEAVKDANTKKTTIRSLMLIVDNERYYVVAPPMRRSILPMSRGRNGSGFLGMNWGTKKD